MTSIVNNQRVFGLNRLNLLQVSFPGGGSIGWYSYMIAVRKAPQRQHDVGFRRFLIGEENDFGASVITELVLVCFDLLAYFINVRDGKLEVMAFALVLVNADGQDI